jgi:hypothetical protein
LSSKGAGEETDRGAEVVFPGEDVGQNDMVPCVVGSEAQGVDQVVLRGGEIAEFVAGHGEIAVRFGHGGICGEGLGKKIGGGAEVALVGLLAALDCEALGFVELLACWFLVGDAGRAIGNSNAQLAGKEREMAQDFFTQRVEIRFVLNAK